MKLKELMPLVKNADVVVHYKNDFFINHLKYFENKEIEHIEIDDFYDNSIAIILKED